MRIVLDLQGAQASNARRGIGRYSLALAKSLARQRGNHELVIALNGAFPHSIDAIRATFDGLLPAQCVQVWDVPAECTVAARGQAAPLIDEHAIDMLRDAFLQRFRPDAVVVSSLFEGFADAAVTGIWSGRPDRRVPVAVVLYDLIPLLRPDICLPLPTLASWYYGKVRALRDADLLLAISESSRQEALDHLGLNQTQQVVNISADADPHFQPIHLRHGQEAALRKRYGLQRPFVMYTGGIDPRKNIEALIRAYGLLPASLRDAHQLAIVCSVDTASRERLVELGRLHGLAEGGLVLTGFVPDEDLPALYSLCHLFVFPSLHEGFGLPVLEAMRCGAPAIGSATTSIPEVIGRADALFDPSSDADIARAMGEVLGDATRRAELVAHAVTQAGRFDWDHTARTAFAAMETLRVGQTTAVAGRASAPLALPAKPRLAYLSPLPPEQSGIADYSAELLPALSRHYRIDVITTTTAEAITDPRILTSCGVCHLAEFAANPDVYDRVVYHIGNSRFHLHMLDLLQQVPGTVVLHDFFLGGVMSSREYFMPETRAWWAGLYGSHGYAAVKDRFATEDMQAVAHRWPVSFGVLRDAQGLIVHSQHSVRLAEEWYGCAESLEWAHIPHLRTPLAAPPDRALARRQLGWREDEFVICSFGLLGPTKQSRRLSDAFASSALQADARCRLVLVGDHHPSLYGEELAQAVSERATQGPAQVSITGWIDDAAFALYLAAADVAVQLRTLSRGETSGAVLHCLNYGLPTIVNSNGSMAELPPDVLVMLPDEFADADLIGALEALWRDPQRRHNLGERARHYIRTQHAPQACAGLYFDAIERFHARFGNSQQALAGRLAALPGLADISGRLALVQSLADNLPKPAPQRQLFVDVSELIRQDYGTGIQRVVKQLLERLLVQPPKGFRIEPVYADYGRPGYRYARQFMLSFMNVNDSLLQDSGVQPQEGDVFLGLDLQSRIVVNQQPFFERWRRRGMRVSFVIYDLLPITIPECFVPEAASNHAAWLQVVAQMDQAICISKAVADQFSQWMTTEVITRPHRPPLDVRWFHLGADLPSNAAEIAPEEARPVLQTMAARISFLMVGTLEPRKGHNQVLEAFEALWARGVDANLVIVGKHGWKVDALSTKLLAHPELGKRLFWLRGINDAYLEQVYVAADCLIAASLDEGFGLPLIEAAQKGLRVIARDIPVFREVAGDHAFYFRAEQAGELADALAQWLELDRLGHAPVSDSMPWMTWGQSAAQLVEALDLAAWR